MKTKNNYTIKTLILILREVFFRLLCFFDRNQRDREGSQKLERTAIPDISSGLDIVAKFAEFKIRV